MDHIVNNNNNNNNKFAACWNLENMAMEGPNSHDMALHNMIHPSDHSIIPMWPPSFPLLLPLHPSSSSSSVQPEPTPWSSLLPTPTPTTSSHAHGHGHGHGHGHDQDCYQDRLMINESTHVLERDEEDEDEEELGAMKEMMYKIAAMQPVDIDPATIRKPKRRNVRISDDPQSVAARHRRERISEKIRILQRLVPGGTKMDTASMLDEAIRYVKFLKRQIRHLQSNPASSLVGPSSAAAASAAARLGYNQNLSFNHEVIND